jgi:nucleoside phosphorylase
MAVLTAGFVVALTWEQRLLKGKLPPDCLVQRSGMGATAAAATARQLLQDGATMLVSCGCCAGLTAELNAGDVLLADQIADESGNLFAADRDCLSLLQQQFAPDNSKRNKDDAGERLRSGYSKLASCQTGRLLSVSEPVADGGLKRQLARQHKVVAADMESFAIASVAADAGVPFVAVRVVLDDHRQALPAAVTACCDDYGTPATMQLLRTCCKQPALLRELAGLARSQRRAANSLRTVAADWPLQTATASVVEAGMQQADGA